MQRNLVESLRLLSQGAQQALDESNLKASMHLQAPGSTVNQTGATLLDHLNQQQILQASKLHGMQNLWTKQPKETNKINMEMYQQNCLGTQANAAAALPFMPTMLTPALYAAFSVSAASLANQAQIFPTGVGSAALFQQHIEKPLLNKRKLEDATTEPSKRVKSQNIVGTNKAVKTSGSRKSTKETKGGTGERGISKPKRKKGETDGSHDEKRTFSSKYRGVYWNRECQAWRARLWHDKKSQHIGNFKSEIEAAKAFDKRAREVGRKELNFPRQSSE